MEALNEIDRIEQSLGIYLNIIEQFEFILNIFPELYLEMRISLW